MISSKNTWVLISGENGTGKEELAKAIHSSSSRSSKPFISVNCSGWSADDLHSHLFLEDSAKFEIANFGTIFIDEVSSLSFASQEVLMKILDEQAYFKKETRVDLDVRVIAATNKNLKLLVSQGSFREDLYFKLNVIPLHLPPLRERGGYSAVG